MLLFFKGFAQIHISFFTFFFTVFFKAFCRTLKQRKRLIEVVFKALYTLAFNGILWQYSIYQ